MTSSIFDLAEITMNAGSSKILTFAVYDSSKNPVSLSGGTLTWYLSYYGDSTPIVTKTGTSGSATNIFIVELEGSDTESLEGLFRQQYKLRDSSGNDYRPSNGIINITSAVR